jgi:hypothetical protein
MTFEARASRSLSNTNNFTVPALFAGGVYFLANNTQTVAVNKAGLFVGTGQNAYPDQQTIATTSADGVTWTTPTLVSSVTGSFPRSMAVSPSGVFIVVGFVQGYPYGVSNNVGVFSTSTNGITWTPWTLFNGFTDTFYAEGVTVSPSGVFVAVGSGEIPNGTPYPQSVGLFSTSTDGITWTTPAYFNGSTTAPFSAREVKFNSDGKWVVMGYQFTTSNPSTNPKPTVSTSTNGTTWTTPTLISDELCFMVSLAVNPQTQSFVAIGIKPNTGFPTYFTYGMFTTSRDGTTWTTPAAMGGSTTTYGNMKGVAINSSIVLRRWAINFIWTAFFLAEY